MVVYPWRWNGFFPETSVTNYHALCLTNPDDRRPQLLRGRNLNFLQIYKIPEWPDPERWKCDHKSKWQIFWYHNDYLPRCLMFLYKTAIFRPLYSLKHTYKYSLPLLMIFQELFKIQLADFPSRPMGCVLCTFAFSTLHGQPFPTPSMSTLAI